MASVTLIEKNRLTNRYDINGKTIDLSLRGNPMILADVDRLGKEVDLLEKRLQNHAPLNCQNDFGLTAANIYNLIDNLYYEQAVSAAVAFATVELENGTYNGFAASLAKYIGLNQRAHSRKIIRFIVTAQHEIKAIADAFFANQNAKTISNADLTLTVHNNVNNQFDCILNGKVVTLCTSGQPYITQVRTLSGLILDLKDAIIQHNEDALKKVIVDVGPSNAQQIINALYKKEIIQFFKDIVMHNCRELRERCHPAALLKDYFGSYRTELYEILLSELEPLIPIVEQYLVDTSPAEFLKETAVWILYARERSECRSTNICFTSNSEQYNAELRQYLRCYAKPWLDNNAHYVRNIYQLNAILMAAHTYLTQDIGVKLTSITDLEHEDLVALMAFLAQDLERQNTTVKRTLLYLKEFYEFTVQMQKIQKPNPFMGIKIPQFIPKDKTKPVTDEAIQQILAHHADMPLDVFLIHALVCITGARVSSICHLTIDALGQTADGRYYVKVINEKNAVKSIVKGRQNFIFHEIFSDLFEEINAYIAKTAHLRKQLDTPYIFVYETEGQYREGSKRLPKVTNAHRVNGTLASIRNSDPFFKDDEKSFKYCCKQLRSKVGADMFSAGYTKSQVSAKLGNTPDVAERHYSALTPRQEAELYNLHYNKAFDHIINPKSRQKKEICTVPVMFGSCMVNCQCENLRDCAHCSERIVSKAAINKQKG